MAFGIKTTPRGWIESNLASLREHLRVPLYANAYALIANQVLTSGLGFLYWILAARLYPTEVVGKNSAILSTILFIATAAELSFKAAMTRFVPRTGAKTTRLVLYALVINLSAAFLIGLFVVTIGPHFSLTASLMASVDFWPGWLILAAMVWCVFYVQDGILTGMRHALWVAIKNTMHSVVKIALLGVFIWLAADYGVVLSWFGPVPIFILLVLALILRRFMPNHLSADTSNARAVHRGEVIRSTLGDYVGTLLFESGVRILPLLVLNRLGEEFTAYYYQAWVVASPVYMIATNMASSFAVEASADMTRIGQTSRRILRQMARIIAPAVLLLWLATPIILFFFGPEYVRESTSLLRRMLLSTLPLTINTWFLNYARVTGNVRGIVLVQGMTSLVAVAGSYLWIPERGIAGIGLAWLLAQTLVAIGVLVRMAPALLSRNEPEPLGRQAARNHSLRRVDWRFFASTDEACRTICFSAGPLRDSMQEAFPRVDQKADGQAYDLAAAAQPGRGRVLELFSALRPGGLAVTEWAAWRSGGARGIRNRLNAAGFSETRLYWPVPGPGYPRLWLPVPASYEACRYAARVALPGRGTARRIGRAALGMVLQLAASTGLVPTLVALSSRPPMQDPDTFEWIRAELARQRPDIPAGQLSFLVQTGGMLLLSKLALMVFVSGDPEPLWVVKVPRVLEDAPTLENEREVLTELMRSAEGRLPPGLLPQPFIGLRRGSTPFFAQTALRGEPLDKILTRANLEMLVNELTDWQITLAEISRSWPRYQTCGGYADQLCTDLAGLLRNHPDHTAELERSRPLLAGLRDLPMVCLHNDFTAWNILRGQRGLRVFDWTDAERSGPPMLDLVYGLAGAFLVLEKAWEADSAVRIYAGLLHPASLDGALFRQCLARYARAIGVPEDQVGPLRLLAWMLNCRLDLRIRRFELGDIPSHYQSMYLQVWKVELDTQTGEAQE